MHTTLFCVILLFSIWCLFFAWQSLDKAERTQEKLDTLINVLIPDPEDNGIPGFVEGYNRARRTVFEALRRI